MKRFRFRTTLAAALLAVVGAGAAATAAAQDYNPDGTPTLRTQCLQNPGLCDDQPPSGSSSPSVMGPIIEMLLRRGWELRQQQLALQREYDVARITFSRPQVQHLLGVWRGAYVCQQGKTGLTLNLDLLKDGSVRGVFDFYPIKGGSPHAERGRYSVRILQGDKHVFVEPLRWLDKPPGYSMVGMAGQILQQGSVYAGEIQMNGCGNFALSKVSG